MYVKSAISLFKMFNDFKTCSHQVQSDIIYSSELFLQNKEEKSILKSVWVIIVYGCDLF